MFVRRLVNGVRSSWDASETSCRCARADSSRAASIVLKLFASRLSSSRPSPGSGGEVSGLGHLLGRVRQPAHGRQRRSRDREAETGGDGDADDGDEEQQHLIRDSAWSVAPSERATSTA